MSVSKSVLFLIGRSATTNPHVAAFLRVQYKHVLHIYTQTISLQLWMTFTLKKSPRLPLVNNPQLKVSYRKVDVNYHTLVGRWTNSSE